MKAQLLWFSFEPTADVAQNTCERELTYKEIEKKLPVSANNRKLS